MKVIGLTGGVACGKTTVAELLAQQGYPVIDTDKIVRDFLSNDEAMQARIQEEFGTTSRARLREIIFSDANRRTALEAILHPRVREVVQHKLDEIRKQKPRTKGVVVIVPLLFEAGWYRNADLTVCVISHERLQIARLRKRDGVPEDLAKRMIASLLPNGEKALRSDFVIQNNDSLPDLRKEVDRLAAELSRKLS